MAFNKKFSKLRLGFNALMLFVLASAVIVSAALISKTPPFRFSKAEVFPADMVKYWNLQPGNYWILEGYNRQQNKRVMTKIEVEEEVRLKGNCWFEERNVILPLRFSKSHYSGYWGPDSWSDFKDDNFPEGGGNNLKGNVNLRFFIVSPIRYPNDGKMLVYSTGEKVYMRNQAEPFADIGWLKRSVNYSLNSGDAPYAYSPLKANSKAELAKIFRYDQTFRVYYFDRNEMIKNKDDLNICPASTNNSFAITAAMQGSLANIETPVYTGEAYVSLQAEQDRERDGYSTREDWYFAKDIGLVRIAQKDFNQAANYNSGNTPISQPGIFRTSFGGDNPGRYKNEKPYLENPSLICLPNNSGSCQCNNVLHGIGPDPSCQKTGGIMNTIDKPMIDVKTTKYYLGWPLIARLADSHWDKAKSEINAKAGQTFELRLRDKEKKFTYEGFVIADSQFFDSKTGAISSDQEKTKVFMKNGKAEIYIDKEIPQKTITVRFKPLISSSKEAQQGGTETRTDYKREIGWSNPVTINIQGKDSQFKTLKLNKYSILTSTGKSNDGFYKEPGIYEPFDARNLVKINNVLQERVFQGTRYFYRSSTDSGATWSDWYTNTLYSLWNNTSSNNPVFPHPDTTMPVDAYSLDYNKHFQRLEERVYQAVRYYSRTSTDSGATWSDWYTNTYASTWNQAGAPDPQIKVLNTSFTYIGPAKWLEEVQNNEGIYQREFKDDWSEFGKWEKVDRPYDFTSDL